MLYALFFQAMQHLFLDKMVIVSGLWLARMLHGAVVMWHGASLH